MLVLRSRRVVVSDTMIPAAVHVRDGLVARVAAYDDVPAGTEVIDVGDSVLMPGLVDTHVHVNEPGRTEWEGFRSATRAAAAGGVTTLLDMPLNSIPAVTTLAALRAKREAAARECWVDVGFLGGVVPGNAAELPRLARAGVFAFKCFLVPSGVDEFPCVTEHDLRVAMPILAGLGATLMVHAELPGPIDAAAARAAAGGPRDPRSYAAYLASRPPEAEIEAVALLVRLCRELGARAHVVHLSAAGALPALRAARDEGLPVTVETCPHYLHFAAEAIPDGATAHKCAPPIRDRGNREVLWDALGEGLIDAVVSDHSPAPPPMKHLGRGDFARAWGGIASLQLGLSVVWAGARERGHGVADVARWMCRAPARLAGLAHRKGAIAEGHDADLVVWDADAELTVAPRTLHHRHKLTPYAGVTLPGVVRQTWLRGALVYFHGSLPDVPTGSLLSRSAHR